MSRAHNKTARLSWPSALTGRLLCVAAGAVWAAVLHQPLLSGAALKLSQPVAPIPITYGVAESVAGSTDEPIASAEIPIEDLPEKSTVPEPAKPVAVAAAPKAPVPAAKPPLAAPAPEEPEHLAAEPPPVEKPGALVAEREPPPAPPNAYAELAARTYTERPGGPVLVLAVLVDHLHQVITTRVMVPSNVPIMDLTYAMSLPGAKLAPAGQGLLEGGTRWIELRIRRGGEALELP